MARLWSGKEPFYAKRLVDDCYPHSASRKLPAFKRPSLRVRSLIAVKIGSWQEQTFAAWHANDRLSKVSPSDVDQGQSFSAAPANVNSRRTLPLRPKRTIGNAAHLWSLEGGTSNTHPTALTIGAFGLAAPPSVIT